MPYITIPPRNLRQGFNRIVFASSKFCHAAMKQSFCGLTRNPQNPKLQGWECTGFSMCFLLCRAHLIHADVHCKVQGLRFRWVLTTERRGSRPFKLHVTSQGLEYRASQANMGFCQSLIFRVRGLHPELQPYMLAPKSLRRSENSRAVSKIRSPLLMHPPKRAYRN